MTNPLVAAASADRPSPWAGIWIAEDIEQIAAGVQGGSWIDGTLGVVGAGLDALAFISDPIGGLLQYGIAWLIEHVKPLSEALDWLAGDPSQIAAHAQTWRNVAQSLRDDAGELVRRAGSDLVDWTGAAAQAYGNHAKRREQSLQALARASDVMALMTEGAGMLIGTVRIMVRDAVATVVSRFIVYAGELIATAGLATPLVAEQAATLCASWAAKISRWLKALLTSLRRLGDAAARLGHNITELGGLDRSNAAADARRADTEEPRFPQHGGHVGRPRNQLDFERQEQWANDAYDNIRRNLDSDAIARNLSDAARTDGSTGFTAAEIEQVRQHVFFEEHPLNDYDGSVVHRRYDASPDMAEAWLRLRSGRQRPEDVALLEHELAESRYYHDHPGSTYEQAHNAANQVSNWQDQIPDPTNEDYSGPWG
jgi:hypothetical protein